MSNTPQQFEFQHVVAAHEFGHMIGIEHIDKPGHSGDAEYGDTWEEASDIMGWGMTVTAHDMKPWIEAARPTARRWACPAAAPGRSSIPPESCARSAPAGPFGSRRLAQLAAARDLT